MNDVVYFNVINDFIIQKFYKFCFNFGCVRIIDILKDCVNVVVILYIIFQICRYIEIYRIFKIYIFFKNDNILMVDIGKKIQERDINRELERQRDREIERDIYIERKKIENWKRMCFGK